MSARDCERDRDRDRARDWQERGSRESATEKQQWEVVSETKK